MLDKYEQDSSLRPHFSKTKTCSCILPMCGRRILTPVFPRGQDLKDSQRTTVKKSYEKIKCMTLLTAIVYLLSHAVSSVQ